jgi:hypothetical protein
MVTSDRWFFSLRLLSQGQLRWSPSSRDNTLLSCPQSDHDLRGDSATEYQLSCSKLAESGSIILTAHTRPSPQPSPQREGRSNMHRPRVCCRAACGLPGRCQKNPSLQAVWDDDRDDSDPFLVSRFGTPVHTRQCSGSGTPNRESERSRSDRAKSRPVCGCSAVLLRF